MLAEEHGVVHDGWAGNGMIELDLTWNRDVATIKVHPWLSYGCSIGARFLIRKAGQPEGRCATVQRVLADDRCVARVDGYTKAEGVKGETLVELMPSTMVRCTVAGYPRDTRLLLLHQNKLVDATVLQWLGQTDAQEGARHMVNVKPPGATTGSQAWPSLNQFNHVVNEDPKMNADAYEEIRLRYCRSITLSEDKVEDAITGNQLQIADQLIFMAAHNVSDGSNPPEYMNVSDVPMLVDRLLEPSPRRMHGSHAAQPVLCRAGPGTGKTWMVKQSLFLLASALSEPDGEGMRLMPVIVFVQRIVRLLREHGDDPTELLQNPEGLMRWYINSEFGDRKEERHLLMLAYEMRCCVILVDGVDEAAGLREVVEAFVHYELVTSGTRLVVTSRPEGVDLEDYKSRFVVMNLLELSQEQQRNVIQMQLQGNAFFEHLVNIGECRKELDMQYRQVFRSEALRNEMESLGEEKETEEEEGDDKEGGSPDGRGRRASQDDGEEGGAQAPSPAKDGKSDGFGDKGSRKSGALERQATMGDFEEEAHVSTTKKKGKKDADERPKRPAASVAILDPANVKPVPRTELVRRRMALDNQQDLQAWIDESKKTQGRTLRSQWLDKLNKTLIKPVRVGGTQHATLLDHLDSEIKALPMPAARAQIDDAIDSMEAAILKAAPAKEPFPSEVREALAQIGMLRKQPQTGGRRGAKAAPMPAYGLWSQTTAKVADKYAAMERLVPSLTHLLGCVCGSVGMADYGHTRGEEGFGDFIAGSAKLTPEIDYRDPVNVWLQDTYPTATEPTDPGPEAFVSTLVIMCATGDHVMNLIKKLLAGVEVEFEGDVALLTKLDITNAFNPDFHHPTHLRNASLHMLYQYKGIAVSLIVQVDHKDITSLYQRANYDVHYKFFLNRVALTQIVFNQKFEQLLIFLVEAIGVPVLLSLLLLTYSNNATEHMIDLDDLPQDRLQLYKLGILSGIKKRLAFTLQANEAVAEVAEKEEEQTAADARPRREKRKGALELTMGGGGGFSGGGGGPAAGAQEDSKKAKSASSNDPVLDLNSVLRGKKVRVVQGEEDVAECYSLVVRVLDKYAGGKGSDLRTSITTVVPKSHSMHAPVTALVEFVIQPLAQTDAALQDTAKKMLRRVAVENQENGRREFTSKHVACALGATPEELGLWTRLDMDRDYGVALTATLAMQSDKAPAQYQFKHLSFQEGLYAEHLLILVTSLAPPQGVGWHGWATDKNASEFLNNRYMNNTCRIAAGHLGALLGQQRTSWDFHEHTLTPNGRSALWFVTDENDIVESINVSQNDVTSDDVLGLANMIRTCTGLKALDLSDNGLEKLTVVPTEWQRVCDSFVTNVTLTDLNLNYNKLGQVGMRIAARALRGCIGLTRLGERDGWYRTLPLPPLPGLTATAAAANSLLWGSLSRSCGHCRYRQCRFPSTWPSSACR